MRAPDSEAFRLVSPAGSMFVHLASFRAPNRTVVFPVFLTTIFVLDDLPDFPAQSFLGEGARDTLELFDREVGFFDFYDHFVGRFSLPPPSSVATLVYSGLSADTSVCSQVKVSFPPTASSVAPDGSMSGAFDVGQRTEFQRHVAGVFDRDLVVHGLADFPPRAFSAV